MALTSSNLWSQWVNLPDDGLTIDSIQNYLKPIPDDLWVAAACVDRLAEDATVQRCLLQLGIERTENAVEQTQRASPRDSKDISHDTHIFHQEQAQTYRNLLVAHFRSTPTHTQLCRMRAILLERLDRLNTFVEISKASQERDEETEIEEWEDDPWADGPIEARSTSTDTISNEIPISLPTFLTNQLVHTACLLASQQQFYALTFLFRRHAAALWPFRFTILGSISEHSHPSLYCNILPGFDSSTNAELLWSSDNWRPEPDWSETPEVKAAVIASGIDSNLLESDLFHTLPSHPDPLTNCELTTWYSDWVNHIISSTGMVDIAIAAIQHGVSQGIPNLGELGEELSLFSRLVYDAPRKQDGGLDNDWTLANWKSMDSASIVQAYLAHSSPETITQNISRLVLPYLFVLESRAERSGTPDPSLHTRLLYDYTLNASLDIAAEIFEASKPTLPANQRIIKSDEDIARLALARLYGSDSLDQWTTMSRILECLPVWDIPKDDGDNAADATVTSLGAFVTPSTTRPRCTASDLIIFFNPLPQASLSRALDILDVHLESGEILSRWSVPAPLRWFLQSTNDEAEQRAWANRLVRRAGNSDGKLETPDDWNWLLEDMLKLSSAGDSGLKGAFCLLSRKEIIRIFLSGLLSTGKFSIAKALLQSSSELSQDAEAVEDICLTCSRELYDNASSGNYKFGDMKLAYECLDVPPLSSQIIKEKEFIEATSRLSSFNVMSRPGIPISPIEIRLTKDRLSLVSRVLSSNTDAYKHTEVILDLAFKLGFRDDKAAEVKVLAMLADTALQDEDFVRSYDTTKRMIDTILVMRSHAPSGIDELQIQEMSEVCWMACFQLGRQPEFDDVNKKLTLLGQALELCPSDKLHDILLAWRRLEKEDMGNHREKLSHQPSRTTASSTEKRITPTIDSLSARLQRFHMSSPSLKPPGAAAIASRTFRSVAATFPFSVTGPKDSDGGAGGVRDGSDVSAQASRVLSKGIGWLIGDNI